MAITAKHLTAKQLASFFRGSVKFNFKKEQIISLSQIMRERDSFFALLDRDAFSALLNDILYYDNQQIDIFMDIYDAELGFRGYADQSKRRTPRTAIAYFLDMSKYHYHSNAITKVYFAFNTWLIFFGEPAITPQWSHCPFCGSATDGNGNCTSKGCKMKSADFLAASVRLADMLMDEREGNETANPDYWDKIVPKSEFYDNYKSEILTCRSNRENQRMLAQQKRQKADVADAIARINALTARLRVETAKPKPDFDGITADLYSDEKIKAAAAYGDAECDKKLTSLKKAILKSRKEYDDKVAAVREREEFETALSEFTKQVVLLEQEYSSSTCSLSELSAIYSATNLNYSKIVAGLNKGYTIENAGILNAVNKYGQETSDKINAYLDSEEHREKLRKAQADLLVAANLVTARIDSTPPNNYKGAEIKQLFDKLIESNDEYSDLRLEQNDLYEQTVKPLREKIKNLIQKENTSKLEEFKARASAILTDLNKCSPADGKAASIRQRCKTLDSSALFGSIRQYGDYKRIMAQLNERTAELDEEEKKYKQSRIDRERARKKHLKRILKETAITLTALVLLFATVLLCELGGALPVSIIFPAGLNEYEGDISDGAITITQFTSDQHDVEVPAEGRLKWTASAYAVESIASGAFSGNAAVQTVTLPSTITTIGERAFSDCENLRRITLNSTLPPAITAGAFYDTDAVFYVPETSYHSYLNDSMWSAYAYRIFPDYGNDREHVSVLFDENGGEAVDDIITYEINSSITLPVPDRTGYVFDGWYYTSADGVMKFDDTTDLVTESIKLTAAWSAVGCTVTFDYNGGSGDVERVTVSYGGTFGELPAAYRRGYTFDGWYYNDEKISSDTEITKIGDIELKARWSVNTYTVSFDYGGGTGTVAHKDVVYDQTYGTLPSPSRVGYIFNGWYLGLEEITRDSIVDIDGDATLRAQWRAITYTLNFNANGGETDATTIVCIYDATYYLPVPVRAGYTFNGWIQGHDTYAGGQSVTNLSSTDGEVITFTASWTANENVLLFDGNGGTGQMDIIYMTTGSSMVLPASTLIRTGYDFIGWSTSPDGGAEYADGAVFTMGAAEICTLYAVWKAKPHTLTLHNIINGEEVGTYEIYSYTDEEITLSSPFEWAGYSVVRWTLSADGSGTGYAEGSPFVFEMNDGEIYSHHLYTVWGVNSNRLNFDANGGTETMQAIYAPSNSTITLPANTFVRSGYTFLGWAVEPDGEVAYADSGSYAMGTDNSYTLYAVWQKDVYTILYALDYGVNNQSNPENYSVDSPDIILGEPTRDGYIFVGWYADENFTLESFDIPTGSTGDKVFYAKWSPNVNILHFDANGGNGTMPDMQLETDSLTTLPVNTFTMKGYSFAGWKESPSSAGADYSDGATYTMGTAGEYTLYAIWELDSYLIEYNLNGGTGAYGNPAQYNVHSGTIVLAAPTRSGYTFGGWCTDPALTDAIAEIPTGSTGNLSLYAKWTANNNTLHFDANGGEGSMPDEIVPTDSEIVLPSNTFTRTGYTFMGWKTSSDESEGAAYINNDIYVMGAGESYTLYAVWKLNTYTVTYVMNGGANNDTNPHSYTVASDKIVFAAPTRAGYTFTHWYSDSSLSTVTEGILSGSTGNLIIYAGWTANTNILHFDPNGGVGTMDDMEVRTGATIALPINAFSREEYKFAGWSTSPGGSSTYSDRAAYTAGASPSVTLYAVWSQTAFTIQYNLDGGINSTANPLGYNTEGEDIRLYSPSKTGNTFDGWFTDATFTNRVELIPSGSEGNITLYAKWVKNHYAVTLDYNGYAGEPTTIDVIYSESYEDLPEPERAGYTFLGWYFNGSLIEPSSQVICDYDHTLVALWQASSYTISFNFNGGTGDGTSKQIFFDTAYGSLPEPVRTGYDFAGWHNGVEIVSADSVMNLAYDHILEAQWTAKTFTITFDYTDGQGSTTSKTVTYGSTYGTLPVATREGYSYQWYYNGRIVTSDTLMTVASNHTLVAVWTINSYKLTINESNTNVTVKIKSTGQEVYTGNMVTYGTVLTISVSADSGYQNAWVSPSGDYTMPAHDVTINSGADKASSCLVKGTLITLADGSTAPIETLCVGDVVMAYDHFSGTYAAQEIVYTYHAFDKSPIITLSFADGTMLEIANAHGLYNATLDRYVLITPASAAEYVGHMFTVIDYDGCRYIRLESCSVEERYVERYDIVTAGDFNHIANGMLACSDVLVGVMNTFEKNELTIDTQKMKSDIAIYGLYEYEEWADYLSYEEFTAFGGSYFKIAVGKGLLSEMQIFDLIDDLRTIWKAI